MSGRLGRRGREWRVGFERVGWRVVDMGYGG